MKNRTSETTERDWRTYKTTTWFYYFYSNSFKFFYDYYFWLFLKTSPSHKQSILLCNDQKALHSSIDSSLWHVVRYGFIYKMTCCVFVYFWCRLYRSKAPFWVRLMTSIVWNIFFLPLFQIITTHFKNVRKT